MNMTKASAKAKASFNFPLEVTRMLLDLGALPEEAGELVPGDQASFYGHVLRTRAGSLWCKPYDNWLACRFDDVARARATVGHGCLNPFSGKWNWHFDKTSPADVQFLREQLVRLL
jgi:hypothetical protein